MKRLFVTLDLDKLPQQTDVANLLRDVADSVEHTRLLWQPLGVPVLLSEAMMPDTPVVGNLMIREVDDALTPEEKRIMEFALGDLAEAADDGDRPEFNPSDVSKLLQKVQKNP